MLFCGVTLAQEPVVDIDKAKHPNLAEAQPLVVEANRYIIAAQKINREDMQGHPEKESRRKPHNLMSDSGVPFPATV